jgi:hypothetical protein
MKYIRNMTRHWNPVGGQGDEESSSAKKTKGAVSFATRGIKLASAPCVESRSEVDDKVSWSSPDF